MRTIIYLSSSTKARPGIGAFNFQSQHLLGSRRPTSVSSRPSWSTQKFPGEAAKQFSETLYQKTKKVSNQTQKPYKSTTKLLLQRQHDCNSIPGKETTTTNKLMSLMNIDPSQFNTIFANTIQAYIKILPVMNFYLCNEEMF